MSGLGIPAVHPPKMRVASADECERSLEVLTPEDQVIWATAMYAGHRRGELLAQHVRDIDLANDRISILRGWDVIEGLQDSKSRAGGRCLPVIAGLRRHLARVLENRRSGLAFGRSTDAPFNPRSLSRRGHGSLEPRRSAPDPPARVSSYYASLSIAAGVNAKSLRTFMGHSSIRVTYDLYGHLFPDAHMEATAKLDRYLGADDQSGSPLVESLDIGALMAAPEFEPRRPRAPRRSVAMQAARRGHGTIGRAAKLN